MSSTGMAEGALDAKRVDQLVDDARRAREAKQFDVALSICKQIRSSFPDAPIGYAEMAAALKQMGRVVEADLIIQDGLSRFPEDERVAVEHAWIAHHLGDWPEAERRWSTIRQRWPRSYAAYYGGGAALRSAMRFKEAEDLYRQAFTLWPTAAGLLSDFAAVAQARGDLDEAARRWSALRAVHPDRPESYLREASALRVCGRYDEAERLTNEALDRFPDDAAGFIESAQIAQQKGNPVEALKRWDAVATRFPGLPDGYVGAAHALNGLGRFADAQNVLRPALRMFPNMPNIAALHAWIAHYQKNFSDALNRWASIREQFPQQTTGYTGAIASLLASSRTAEADALAKDAIRLFPADVHVAMSFARVPQQIQDWNESVHRWRTVYNRHSNIPAVGIGYAQALSRAEQWNDASVILASTVREHSEVLEVHKAHANYFAQRRKWIEAEKLWRNVIERFPQDSAGWAGLAETLRAAGRLDDAERAIEDGLSSFPTDMELARQKALTATLRRNWPVALRLWDELKRQYPSGPGIVEGITQALWQARQDLGVAAAEGRAFKIPDGLITSNEENNSSAAGELNALFMKFESIGDTCEFGIVQRRFGAEPISLLRWASTNPANLVRALDDKFEGVGEADHTVIAVSHGEYTTRDKRYHMFSHTFTPETAEPIEVFTKQHLRRMQYLRRKLLGDLSEGDKVFVYKCNSGLSDEEARAIFAAIRRYGGSPALLCVRLEDDAHPRGMLHNLEDGLFIGYIDRFSTVDINVDVWVELCRNTMSRLVSGAEITQAQAL